MTKDDMIRLARKAGLWSKYGAVMMNDDVAFVHAQTGDWPELQAFADLCAAETSTVQPNAVDEIAAWECLNCGDVHRLNVDRCICGWTRARGWGAFGAKRLAGKGSAP
jgi:hypothetical protein